jgi:hypothetical protein
VGHFLATSTGNGDLNFIGTQATLSNPVRFAWGTFANDGIPVGTVAGVRLAAAKREFTGGDLAIGQSLGVALEHGNIRSGNLNPQNGRRDAGWVGITLRASGLLFPFVDAFTTFGQIDGLFGFGFLGGAQEYMVYDAQSPSGRSSGVPFTRDGVRLEFTLTAANTYQLKVHNAATNALLATINGPISGSPGNQIGAIVVHNRNAEDSDVFFNSLSVSNLCVADTDNGSGAGTPDGGVGIEDLLYYLSVYDAGTSRADVDDGTGTGTPDGGVGIEDLLYYLQRYDVGC